MHTEHHTRWFRENGDENVIVNYPLTEDSWVLELGGYEGSWTDKITKLYNCNVIVVEPIPDFANILAERFKNNPKVHIVNNAVTAESKKVTFNICGDATSETLISSERQITIKSCTLEDIIESFQLSRIDLIQMNIEGEEFNLLPALIESKLLTKCNDIHIQFHNTNPSCPAKRESIQQGLRDLGFELSWNYEFVWESWRNKYNKRSEKVKVKKMAGTWGECECSSNRNLPKTMEWVPMNSYESCEHKIYIDENIMKIGIFEPGDNKIGWLLESPQINTETISWILNNLDQIKKHYKYVFTCIDSLLALGAPFVYTISNAVPWIWMKNRKIYKKTKLVSMIASNKGLVKGHQNRLEWVERLKDKVDLFGTGRPNQLTDKEDGLRDYMFSVSIENDDSDSYFTEKLTDNFVMGTVPVFWGSRKVVEKYFDARGVIFLEDDPTLSTVTLETYEAMKPYIEDNFRRAMEMPIAEDYIYETYLK